MRCVSTQLTAEQRSRIFPRAHQSVKPEFGIERDKVYLVLAVTVGADDVTSPLVTLLNRSDHIVHVPVVLFEIVDPRVSGHWQAQWAPSGALMLAPKEFFAEHFHENFSDGEPSTKAAFSRALEILESED